MTYKLLVAAALSLGLATATAMAQTSPTQPDAGASPSAAPLPMGWDGAIGDAFFANPGLGTLRSQEEVTTNWQTLTAEQQAQVRTHCDTVDTAGAATPDSQVTTGSTTADATHTASIKQVCDWVDAM